MCTVILLYKMNKKYPILCATNRDDYIERESGLPHLISKEPRIFAYLEKKFLGTNMGINEYGLFVILTNRPKDSKNDPKRRSRGLLLKDLLKLRSEEEVREKVSSIGLGSYNSCNILFLTKRSGYIARILEESIDIAPVSPGVHILANGDMDDYHLHKVKRSKEIMKDLDFSKSDLFIKNVKKVLVDHITGEDEKDAICIHTSNYKTLSSSIFGIGEDISDSFFYFTLGNPCQNEYMDFTKEFLKIFSI